MRALVLFVLALAPLFATVIDRIAVVVDQQVITETQVDEEIRVTSFLNRQPAKWSADDRRAAADRLIQQQLVEREMKVGHYPPPTSGEVDKYFAGLVDAFSGPTRFANSLNAAKLNEQTLKQHLALQLTTLRFIEYRFRPNFEITDSDIAQYRKRENSRARTEAVREILIQQRTDEILASWLEESRKQVNIIYLDGALQ